MFRIRDLDCLLGMNEWVNAIANEWQIFSRRAYRKAAIDLHFNTSQAVGSFVQSGPFVTSESAADRVFDCVKMTASLIVGGC